MTPIDESYKLTKLIKQGKEIPNTDFAILATWIDKIYHVKTLNIIYDKIDLEKRPRLQIILENSETFFKNNFAYEDEVKVRVLNQFKELLLINDLSRKYKTDKIFAFFSDFEEAAKTEVRWNIPLNTIEEFQATLNIKEVWRVYPETFYSITVFLYKNEQVENFLKNGMKEYLNKKCFELLKKYDEFDYYQKGQFSILLESKDNFDQIYNSNWFNYDRR